MQGQHLRNYSERTAAGLNFSRQIIGGCEAVGECDIAAMNQALNAYLRVKFPAAAGVNLSAAEQADQMIGLIRIIIHADGTLTAE